jgi:hypothetical protein
MVPFLLRKRKTKIGCPIFVYSDLLHDEEAASLWKVNVKTSDYGLFYALFILILL